MYLYLGGNVVVKNKEVIGIFDIDNTTAKKDTRDYLEKSENKNIVYNVSMDIPRSFCVCAKEYKMASGGGKNKKDHRKKSLVYISQLSPDTLKKRATTIY